MSFICFIRKKGFENSRKKKQEDVIISIVDSFLLFPLLTEIEIRKNEIHIMNSKISPRQGHDAST